MEWLLVLIIWMLCGIMGLLVLDIRVGNRAGTGDEISWIVAAILGPIILALALSEKP
jgi:hypothetical protein